MSQYGSVGIYMFQTGEVVFDGIQTYNGRPIIP